MISWLFARPQGGGQNGFSITGGVLNYTAEVTYPETGDKLNILFQFKVTPSSSPLDYQYHTFERLVIIILAISHLSILYLIPVCIWFGQTDRDSKESLYKVKSAEFRVVQRSLILSLSV